jgi:hypothetical protein
MRKQKRMAKAAEAISPGKAAREAAEAERMAKSSGGY